MTENLSFYYPEKLPNLPELDGSDLKKAVETRFFDNNLIFMAASPTDLGIQGKIDKSLSTILIETRMFLSLVFETNVPQQEVLLGNMHFRRISSPFPSHKLKSAIIGSELRDLIVIGVSNGKIQLTSGLHKPDNVLAIPLDFFRNNKFPSQEDLMKNSTPVPVKWVSDVNELDNIGLKNLLEIINIK